jgi:hypothetical protein
MANLFMDSIQTYGQGQTDLTTRYSAVQGASVELTAGRGGNTPAVLTGAFFGTQGADARWRRALGVNAARLYAGARWRFASSGGGTPKVLTFMHNATDCCGVRIDATGAVTAFNPTGDLATAAALASTSAYQYIELGVPDGFVTSGRLVVRLNGNVVLDLSGVDTRGGGPGTANTVQFGPSGQGGIFSQYSCHMQDLYVNDGTGSRNNTFWGDVAIDARFPNSTSRGDSSIQGSAPAPTRHQSVSQSAPDGDTTFNLFTGPGEVDLYGIAPYSAAAAQGVYAVQVVALVKGDTGGGGTGSPTVRSGGVAQDGPTLAVPGTYTPLVQTLEANPNGGGALTVGAVNAMLYGFVKST